jgi:tyrosine-protein phosphatase YwqE
LLIEIENEFITNNNVRENEIMIISTVLNPAYRLDFFFEDEFERVKEIFDELLGKAEERNVEHEIELGREIRNDEIDEYKLYTKEPCSHMIPTLSNWLTYWELNKT